MKNKKIEDADKLVGKALDKLMEAREFLEKAESIEGGTYARNVDYAASQTSKIIQDLEMILCL